MILQGRFSLTWSESLPPFLVLSLGYILNSSAKNWEYGNESSILVSDSGNISVLVRIVCWKFVSHGIYIKVAYDQAKCFGYARHCLLNPISLPFSVSEDSEGKDSF